MPLKRSPRETRILRGTVTFYGGTPLVDAINNVYGIVSRHRPKITGRGDAADKEAWSAVDGACSCARREWAKLRDQLIRRSCASVDTLVGFETDMTDWLSRAEAVAQRGVEGPLSYSGPSQLSNPKSLLGRAAVLEKYAGDHGRAFVEPADLPTEDENAGQPVNELAKPGTISDAVVDMERPPGSSLLNTDVWNELTDRQRDCLRVLQRQGAFNADTRQRAEDIAIKAEGYAANANGFKKPLSNLALRCLVSSKTGREGGYWLMDDGCKLVEMMGGGARANNACA